MLGEKLWGAGVDYQGVVVGRTEVAIVHIVRACRGVCETLGAEMKRHNALFATQGRRGERTGMKKVQQCSRCEGRRCE
jgi:hypothetical protein